MTEMAEVAQGFDIDLIEDKTDPYFTGSQAWFSSVFSHFTTSVTTHIADGEVAHSFDLEQMGREVPAAESLTEYGFSLAGKVGKLMTFDRGALNHLAQTKGRDPELLRKVATPQVGFTTGLFVARRVSDFFNDLPGVEDPANEDDIFYQVAGVTDTVTSSGGEPVHTLKRVLSKVQGNDHPEVLYMPTGQRQKPAKLPENVWTDIGALHTVLHQKTVEAIHRKVLLDELASMLSLRWLESA